MFAKIFVLFFILAMSLVSGKPQIAASLGLGGLSVSSGPGATAGQGIGGAAAGNAVPVVPVGPVVPVDPVTGL